MQIPRTIKAVSARCASFVGALCLATLCGCGATSGEHEAHDPSALDTPPPQDHVETHVPEVDTDGLAEGVRIVLHDLRSEKGKVGCALFTSEVGFPQHVDVAQQATWCEISGARATCEFHNVPTGPCAIGCFHDENQDGLLATGLYGMPLEGIAASNNAPCVMGPPRYQDARWDYTGAPTVLPLRMTYSIATKQSQ